MGIELNSYKRSVSVSDAITKLFSPFAFYLFHSTKSARHDDNTLPRTGVHSRSRRWVERVPPTMTIKIKEDEGSKTIQLSY